MGEDTSFNIWSCYSASSLRAPDSSTRPEWMLLMWYLRDEFLEKKLLQKTHSNGLSFMCIDYVWSLR